MRTTSSTTECGEGPGSWRPPGRGRLRSRLLGLAGLAFLVVGSLALPASATGAWQWPLRPAPDQVVRGFDPPEERWGAGHRGVDLRGSAGTQVHAAGAGVVTFAGLLAGRRVVTITHVDLRTTYEPVTPVVEVGDLVQAGDVIGTLGLIGGHCLPQACLHWGLLRGTTYLDPLSLVGAGPVRLLPLQGGPALRASPAPAGSHVRSSAAPGKAPVPAGDGQRARPPPAHRAAMGVVSALAAGGAALSVLTGRRRQRLD